MQTILDVSDTEAQWLVKLVAGLPGGIGNTGFECGGVMAPMVLLGLRHGLGTMQHGLPLLFYKGHHLLRRFYRSHHTLLCREIRGRARLPLRCVRVIRHAPELYRQILADDSIEAISGEQKESYCHLYAHLTENRFHCAHAVFQRLGAVIPTSPELRDGTSAFVAGTVLTGGTCSAFAAGVMALSLRLAEIEHSRLRVLRMIGLMAIGGDAFADDVNKFNKVMNLGDRLSKWFRGEFGSTQCRTIMQCDFSSLAGVDNYIESGCVTECRVIANSVAEKVQVMLDESAMNRDGLGAVQCEGSRK